MTRSSPRLAASLRQVSKNYGSGDAVVKALDRVDLDVYAGELLLLVGPSGCGKTTLLSVLAGVLDASTGEVCVFEQKVSELTQSKKTRFRRNNVGVVFQQFNLLPTLTATENVAIPLLVHRQPYYEALKEARRYLGLVGLSTRCESRPADLSGGQQQRVAIARAMVVQPKLIVCDEPTASLDGDTGQQIMHLLREEALSPERAIVVVTHDNRIFDYGDRIATMLDGRLVSTQPIQRNAK